MMDNVKSGGRCGGALTFMTSSVHRRVRRQPTATTVTSAGLSRVGLSAGGTTGFVFAGSRRVGASSSAFGGGGDGRASAAAAGLAKTPVGRRCGILGVGVGVGVGIGSGTAMRRCRLVVRASSEADDIDQLERQAKMGEINVIKDTSGNSPSTANSSSSSSSSDEAGGPSPAPRRGPPNPFYRMFLKLKLYTLLAMGMAYKAFRAVFSNMWFAAIFTVFVGASTMLGVKAVAARRAGARPAANPTVLYSHFTKDLAAKKVKSVRFEEGTTRILYELREGAVSCAPSKMTDGKPINMPGTTAAPSSSSSKSAFPAMTMTKQRGTVLQTKRIPDEKLMTRLETAGVEFGSIAAPPTSFLSKTALSMMALWIPLVPLYIMFRNMANKQGGGDKAKKARKDGAADKQKPVTFADVAGVDEAKDELVELVEMLKSAEKYKHVRKRLPTGCLLVGPPGTGKTLLARAVAGEAGVPFFAVAASEFVELFVGRGAARVRELFAEARKSSPAVVFIDELDAIGARRGAGLNEERDQTLNQMLVEMDGFNKPRGVLVLAATNRAEALDPALLRPGRLTRRVFVGPPDIDGREKILSVHLRGVDLAEGMEETCRQVAQMTNGFTGAELANVVNEGVLLAARNDRLEVTVDDLFQGTQRTKNGVGIASGGAGVLARLRRMVRSADGSGRNNRDGGGGDSGDFGGGGGGKPGGLEAFIEGISEGNKKQGVGMSMPPT